MIVFGSDKEGDCCFVEATSLAVPFLDRVQGALSRKVEHEQNGDGVIADKWKHVDEFALTAEIPDRERDFCVPD